MFIRRKMVDVKRYIYYQKFIINLIKTWLMYVCNGKLRRIYLYSQRELIKRKKKESLTLNWNYNSRYNSAQI